MWPWVAVEEGVAPGLKRAALDASQERPSGLRTASSMAMVPRGGLAVDIMMVVLYVYAV